MAPVHSIPFHARPLVSIAVGGCRAESRKQPHHGAGKRRIHQGEVRDLVLRHFGAGVLLDLG